MSSIIGTAPLAGKHSLLKKQTENLGIAGIAQKQATPDSLIFIFMQIRTWRNDLFNNVPNTEAVNMNRIDLIRPADKASGCAAKAQWDSIGKPLGSLGLLEEAIIKIASIQGTPDVCIDHRTVVVLCADNGVVQEGVTQTDSSVTATCADAIANGTS